MHPRGFAAARHRTAVGAKRWSPRRSCRPRRAECNCVQKRRSQRGRRGQIQHGVEEWPRLASGWIWRGRGPFRPRAIFFRRPGVASSLDASQDDDGTTRMLLTSAGLAYGLPPVLRRLPLPMMPSAAAAIGLIIQAGGLALWVWSMRTLGSFYTRTLRTSPEQHLVNTELHVKLPDEPVRVIGSDGVQPGRWCAFGGSTAVGRRLLTGFWSRGDRRDSTQALSRATSSCVGYRRASPPRCP